MSTGAGNDIERATEMARKMVCEWGMSDLGPMTFGKKEEQIFLGREIAQHRDYSEDTAIKIDRRSAQAGEQRLRRAKHILERTARRCRRLPALCWCAKCWMRPRLGCWWKGRSFLRSNLRPSRMMGCSRCSSRSRDARELLRVERVQLGLKGGGQDSVASSLGGLAAALLFVRRARSTACGCKSRPNLMEVKGSEAQGRHREVGSERERGAKIRADVQEPD